jgi:hypothetical protein
MHTAKRLMELAGTPLTRSNYRRTYQAHLAKLQEFQRRAAALFDDYSQTKQREEAVKRQMGGGRQD